MSKLVLNGDTSGSVTLDAPAVSGTTTLTLPTTTSTLAINGPAFSAYLSSNQSITSSTATKIACNIEEFDTNSNYDTSTYRFTPTVAGYYQVNVRYAITGNGATILICYIYKNGAEAKRGTDYRFTVSTGTGGVCNTLIYMNGSTDYIEAYAYITGTTPSIEGTSFATYFQASMVRGA